MTSGGHEADLHLALALAAGDPEAARRLCETYLPLIFRFVLARSGLTSEEAADIAQDTTVAALRAAHAYRGESSFLTWLTAIARRKCADHYRRERRAAASGRNRSWTAALDLIDDAPLPDEVVENEEVAAAVHLALWGLPEPQREALLLKYVDELTVAEVARDLGRTEKSVESLLARGRTALRGRLAEWGSGRSRNLGRSRNPRRSRRPGRNENPERSDSR